MVFTVTPFKIDQNQNQNSSIDKVVQNREKNEGKYAKILAKIQVTAIFLMQDMRSNFFHPNLIAIFTDTSVIELIATKSVNLSLGETKNIKKNNTFSNS